MRPQIFLALSTAAAAFAFATPAAAQDEDKPFEGLYIGATVGYDVQPNDVGEAVSFDRNLDGRFGDTVTTAGGADAFSPGFCNGQARGATRTPGCINDRDSIGYSGRVGYDWQTGHLVLGIAGEFGKNQIKDSVTAFSVTPASYTLNREVLYDAALKSRIGYAANNTLFYVSGGGKYARVNNYFRTTNTVNGFSANGDTNAWGFTVGGGIEQKISKHISLGVEYAYNNLRDDDYRVRVSGGPINSPFTLAGAGGTDLARSYRNFRWHSMRATIAYRF